MKKRVMEVLEKVRPILQRDGGNVKLISASEEGIVKVELQGACVGCPGAKMTLKMLIERILKEEIPEVKEVIGV
ncbi:NifU family protein [Crassaminicella profunda]|uniref:NifU family protein n=1 Tax=Crassaminicella profunda TaxID=1286698 RepID=UPI001CA6BA85|nr:NifU family protein [Crassaminicella profunda]QZY56188.1 NifU family protein [Crassaminicella profunda]